LDLRYTNQFYTTLSNGAYNFTINSDDGYYNFNRLAGSGAAVSTFDANGNLGRFDFDGVSSHYLAGNGTWGTVPSAIDTTSLSNRINLKQNFSDTSTYDATRSWTNTALGSYMKYTDTAGLSSRINTKQNFSDTSTWDATRSWVLGQIPSLTGYQLYSDTSTFDATRAWTNTALGSYMKYTDTVGLSNRINLKLNSSDTASLSNRINLKLNSSDTASLSARINTKQSSTLTSGYLWVGSTGNVATGTPLSGDATISSTGAMTLAASGVTAGSYGSSTAIPTVTVDAKGRITSIGTATVSAGGGTVTSVSAGADITITGTASVNPTVALTAATVYTITETTSFTFNGNNSGIQVITMANANDSVTLTNITEGRQIPYEFIVKRSTASAVLYWNTTVKSAYGGGAQPPQSTPTTCIDRYFITKREGTIYVSYELCDN
jgi:hypothetical protein